jgi:hypothetical protein
LGQDRLASGDLIQSGVALSCERVLHGAKAVVRQRQSGWRAGLRPGRKEDAKRVLGAKGQLQEGIALQARNGAPRMAWVQLRHRA